MSRVAVIGTGVSKFGERDDVSLRELAAEATEGALKGSGLEVSDLEASVFGVANQYLAQQVQPGAIINSYLGLTGKPSFTTTDACASGSAAIRAGWMSIRSGVHDVVLVVGAEKMNGLKTLQALEAMGRAGDPEWELNPTGITDTGLYAIFANAHMKRFGTTEEQLAKIAVKNYKYGSMNPISHLKKKVEIEDVLNSSVVSAPLKLHDCSLVSDGAASVVLASEEAASKLEDDLVYIDGIGCSTDTAAIFDRESLTELKATRLAAERAYKMAKVEPKDIDIADVHDCFTIAELLAYEDLGFCEKGEGGNFIEERKPYKDGETPINIDGGLKAKGHPLGATGVAMAAEITEQLKGNAGKRQVNGAEIGLTHNVARDGTHAFVHVFRRG